MKTSSLYENMFIIRKIIKFSDAENNCMQNSCVIKWMKYRNVPLKHKKCQYTQMPIHTNSNRHLNNGVNLCIFVRCSLPTAAASKTATPVTHLVTWRRARLFRAWIFSWCLTTTRCCCLCWRTSSRRTDRSPAKSGDYSLIATSAPCRLIMPMFVLTGLSFSYMMQAT